VKWGAPILGQGATVSYAVARGDSKIAGNINCLQVTGIEGLLARSHVARQQFDRELAEALSMWQAAANIRFVRAKRMSTADILISAQAVPEGIAYADVTLDGVVERGVSRVKRGLVCLNPDIRWSTARSQTSESGAEAESREGVRLRYALAHEIGHVLGLDHPGPEGELMSFEYGSHFEGLKPGDIAGITTLYGRRSSVPGLALNSRSTPVR
jgi:predicted Zn-dependent protease